MGEIKSSFKFSRKILAIVIVVLGIFAILLLYNHFIIKQILVRPPWFFEGAYAEYKGATSGTYFFTPYAVEINIRLEVMKIEGNNATVAIATRIIMHGIVDQVETYNRVLKINVNEENIPFTEGFRFVGKTYTYVPNFGIRKCLVYEAKNPPYNKVYIDEKTKWPIVFEGIVVITEDLKVKVLVEVVNTNIPELKKS